MFWWAGNPLCILSIQGLIRLHFLPSPVHEYVLMHHLIDPTCTYLLHSCIGVPEKSPGGCGGWPGALPVLWSGCGSNITPDSGTGIRVALY